MRTAVEELSTLSGDAFVERLGHAFEASPWIARAAWDARPFASVAELVAAFSEVIESAPRADRLALLRAHPDLGGRAAMADELTDASRSEQRGAGLTSLDPERYGRLLALNERYTARFGFPAIICVRDYTVDEILAEFERRLGSSQEAEEEEAVRQVCRIAGHRLRDEVTDGAPAHS